MPLSPEDLARIALVGLGATAFMDAWLALLRRFGVPTLNFALLGRWVGHLAHGRVRHAAIARAAAVPRETALGWIAHYATGVAFAGLMALIGGTDWLNAPRLAPALAVGFATVVAPLFVMQPAMGAGIASSRTPAPLANCLRSAANHTVFGAGMYFAALAVASVTG